MGGHAGGPGPGRRQHAGSGERSQRARLEPELPPPPLPPLSSAPADENAPGGSQSCHGNGGGGPGARAAGARPAAAEWGRWGLMHPDQGAVTPHMDRSPAAPASPAASGCQETRGHRDCELLPPVSHSYPTGGPVAAAPPGFLEGPSVPFLDLRLAYSGDPWQFPLELSLLDRVSVTRPREWIPSNPSWRRNSGAPCAPALDPHGVCGG